MQIVVTAVQNAVERRDMGSATSSVTFFRTMGGAFGTAIFGAVLTNRLGHHLARSGAGADLAAGGGESELANNVQAIQALPPQLKVVVLDAWVNAVHDVFLAALPFAVAAFILAFFIPERELLRADSTPPDNSPPGREPVLAREPVLTREPGPAGG